MRDFDDTIELLKDQADHLEYCRSERLRKMGLRKIHFRKHRYLLVYRIKNDKVIVEGMYHELQDYENAIEQHKANQSIFKIAMVYIMFVLFNDIAARQTERIVRIPAR